MSDLTPDEQALIDSGEFILMSDLITQIQSRIPEVKSVTVEYGKINFWLEPPGKKLFRFGLALNASPLQYKIGNQIVIRHYRPECIVSIGDVDGYIFVIRDAIQNGGAS